MQLQLAVAIRAVAADERLDEAVRSGRENHLKAARIIEQAEESMTSGITAAERAAARAALRAIAGG